jgi:hypothetical protein
MKIIVFLTRASRGRLDAEWANVYLRAIDIRVSISRSKKWEHLYLESFAAQLQIGRLGQSMNQQTNKQELS